MSYDKYVEGLLDSYHQDEEARRLNEEENRAYIEWCIANNEPINYDGINHTEVANCDLYDRVYAHQLELMQALQSGDGSKVLKIMNALYEEEIQSYLRMMED